MARGLTVIIRFLDKHYKKVNWFITFLCVFVFFFFRNYMTGILFLLIIVHSVKYRQSIKKAFQSISFKAKLAYLFGFFFLISILTVVMINSLTYLNTIGAPLWLEYVYIFIIINVATFGYLFVMRWLIKRKAI
ncbi:hypothetical protein D0463_05005 [Bacillus sp. V59.32b]|nr:hypothetical protein D0463_05005 [Bacillus sp. V59.32b]